MQAYIIHPQDSNPKYTILPNFLLIWQVSLQDVFSSFQCVLRAKLTGEELISSPGRIILQGISRPRPLSNSLPATLSQSLKFNQILKAVVSILLKNKIFVSKV